MRKHFVWIGLAILYVLFLATSCCHKEEDEKIKLLVDKVWFTRTEERWNTDYYNQYLPESYRSWTFYTGPGDENWLYYFIENSTSYLIHTKNFDTVYYPFEYVYYPKGDSIYIEFKTVNDSVEDYHADVEKLTEQYLTLCHEYRPHQFERVSTTNVSNSGTRRSEFKFNPKNIKKKPAGLLIPIK